MGMAASQCRLLQLTSRKISIGRQLSSLSLQKQSLTREMRDVSRNYNEALSSKTYKWTNNSGATYVDLSYANLMSPGAMNQNQNYLITDLNDRVVVDSNYKQYAEMISANGHGGANWGGDTRLEVLSALTGLSKDTIQKNGTLLENCYKADQALLDAENKKPILSQYHPQKSGIGNLVKAANNGKIPILGNGSIPWGGDVYIRFSSGSSDFCNLKQLGKYLGSDKNKEAWENAIDDIIAEYAGLMEGKKELSGVFNGPTSDGYKIDWDELASKLITQYKACGGEVYKSDNAYNGKEQIVWYTETDLEKYNSDYTNWENNIYNKAKKEYENTVDEYDQSLTADQKSKLKFYDNMFAAIAEQGWVYNMDVDDDSYLNEMLQNNQYTITKVNSSTEFDSKKGKVITEYSYDTSIASNFMNIVSVSDNDAREEAAAQYEYQKSLISEKESRIDTRMKNLETEQSAISQMIQGIEAVRNKNIETNFSIFS